MPSEADTLPGCAITEEYTSPGCATAEEDTPPGSVLTEEYTSLPPRAIAEQDASPGRIIAGRYRLARRLGEGAHGEVWAADDLVTGTKVALKWMLCATGSVLTRVRREITTLRMLRVPGVVRLLDEGVENGRPFLVMELVDGRPFPGSVARAGTPARSTWEALAGPTLLLLEILSRVHAAGVVHRDLKPDNVLVSGDGRPTVLDFGISLWSDPSGDRLTGAGQILGTPRYLAPEQILSKAADARTDLYAAGVMLYELLTGRVPHEGPDVASLLRARLVQPVPRVRDVAPEVPRAVAEVIDRLLAKRIEGRFRSASEVVSALRGEVQASGTGPILPWLGSRHAVGAVVEAVMAGRSIDVAGPPGSGRSRCLREAAELAERQGRRVIFTEPARSPLAGLRPVVGAPEEHAALRLAEVTAWVQERVRTALAEGVAVFADTVEELDPWSAAVLDDCLAGPGTVVRALCAPVPGSRPAQTVRIEPLDEAALRPLFAGPDRLFHLREDAARLLRERTEGLAARVEAEVTLWARVGLGRWDGSLFVVDRDALDRLRRDVISALPVGSSPARLQDESNLEELLCWLAIGGHHLELVQLAQVMGQPVWKLEAECGALVARGAARWLDGLRVLPCGHVDITWLPSRRIEVHRALASALRPGQEGRLFHLLAAELVQESACEAVEVARRHAREGHLGAATMALGEGLQVLREQSSEASAEQEARILAEWVKVAFAEDTPRAMDRVLYEISRARGQGADIHPLESLVRAAVAAPGAGHAQALKLADSLAPFADAELERRRQGVRICAAAARASPAMLEAALQEVAAWAETTGEPLAELSMAEGRALLCYLQGRFEQAAALHAQAAALDPWQTGRIAASLKCASALLEAFRHREAAERAASARDLAAACRHPYWEGRAEWLLRAALYRMGEAGAPDLELVDAVGRVGVANLEGLVCLNEAAVAFRAGDREVAVDLADRAVRAWRPMDREGAVLARSLAIACGAPAEQGEVERLAGRALQCELPGIGVQVLALLGQALPEARQSWRDALPRLVEGIPRQHWGQRMDVLSVEEALEGYLDDRIPRGRENT